MPSSPGPSRPQKDDTESSEQTEDEFGSDIELDDELQSFLIKTESQGPSGQAIPPGPLTEALGPGSGAEDLSIDVEDIAVDPVSPFEQFRSKGWLSVSDLVGTVWCEVQYDYRLRTLPFLPPEKRPDVITSKDGSAIVVDKVKVQGKERILRRGEARPSECRSEDCSFPLQKIHKRLEREIHPQEIIVHAVSREDVWGLRFLNMFSALEALLTIGKCRELPVVGFVRGVLVMGIIDEITRQAINGDTNKRTTRSSAVPDSSQTSINKFFSATKPRKGPEKRPRTHKLFVSDSKTRASGTVPRESDTLAGKLQVMLYKELLDAMLLSANQTPLGSTHEVGRDLILPTEQSLDWPQLFLHLELDIDSPFTEQFVVQSRPIITGNSLRHGVADAENLRDMIKAWVSYVGNLGLGTPSSKPSKTGPAPSVAERITGRTEDRLELVYRRAGPSKKPRTDVATRRRRGRRRKSAGQTVEADEVGPNGDNDVSMDADHDLQRAIAESLAEQGDQSKTSGGPLLLIDDGASADATEGLDTTIEPMAANETAGSEDELAWAAQMSLDQRESDVAAAEEKGEFIVRTSQALPHSSPNATTPSPPTPSPPLSDMEDVGTPPVGEASNAQQEEPDESANASSKSGAIIGRTVFYHSPRRLATHLASVLQWWMGERDAIGVSLEETRRCGWCEFEENCEWRAKKAQEVLNKRRGHQDMSL